MQGMALTGRVLNAVVDERRAKDSWHQTRWLRASDASSVPPPESASDWRCTRCSASHLRMCVGSGQLHAVAAVAADELLLPLLTMQTDSGEDGWAAVAAEQRVS